MGLSPLPDYYVKCNLPARRLLKIDAYGIYEFYKRPSSSLKRVVPLKTSLMLTIMEINYNEVQKETMQATRG